MTTVGHRQVDISEIEAINAANDKARKRLPWDTRVALIEKHFPTVRSLDWKGAFDRDLDLFAWILQDILKSDGAAPGRSGPKPRVDIREGAARLRTLMGEDYSVDPFPETFKRLAGDRSLTALARKTGIARSQVHRLLTGVSKPTGWEMERIAKSFGMPAGHFAEYRLGLVVAAMADRLAKNPDATVKYWRELALAGA